METLKRSAAHLPISHSGISDHKGKDIQMQIAVKATPEWVMLSPVCILRTRERNLINECPETRQEKGIEWEKEKSKVGEDVVKDWTFETRKAENDGKSTDWSQDGGDTFYSLTEESEAGSSGCDLREEDGNASSTAESLSSAVGPTVGPQRWQRKCLNSRIGTEDSPGECAETLKWDYSGIRLSQPGNDFKVLKDMSLSPTQSKVRTLRMGRQTTWLVQIQNCYILIYGTVRELQRETQAESRRARMATKQLQVVVRKIA
ncbi:hypothetical protein NDU88_005008 [Pleurodeles waltl]|uniref:Uncharacterized protein n=1 Tax=Pleurodeles waltl TaxID=8319 RepID=A0AAV7TUE4_PLEWA|nr:hypothetical protein NDU88_005008 [Pleurodeles waltl]